VQWKANNLSGSNLSGCLWLRAKAGGGALPMLLEAEICLTSGTLSVSEAPKREQRPAAAVKFLPPDGFGTVCASSRVGNQLDHYA
jgi:hypothetical protein